MISPVPNPIFSRPIVLGVSRNGKALPKMAKLHASPTNGTGWTLLFDHAFDQPLPQASVGDAAIAPSVHASSLSSANKLISCSVNVKVTVGLKVNRVSPQIKRVLGACIGQL